MPHFPYNKHHNDRDRAAAEEIDASSGHYAGHSEKHLRNALRFARGCAGLEAKARARAIRAEIRSRNAYDEYY